VIDESQRRIVSGGLIATIDHNKTSAVSGDNGL